MIDVYKYLCARYKLHPRDEHEYNCWTLVQSVYKDNGRSLEAFNFRDEMELKTIFPEAIDRRLDGSLEVVDKPCALDIVTMRFVKRWLIGWHCGVMVDDKDMLHISRDIGKAEVVPLSSLRKRFEEIQVWR